MMVSCYTFKLPDKFGIFFNANSGPHITFNYTENISISSDAALHSGSHFDLGDGPIHVATFPSSRLIEIGFPRRSRQHPSTDELSLNYHLYFWRQQEIYT